MLAVKINPGVNGLCHAMYCSHGKNFRDFAAESSKDREKTLGSVLVRLGKLFCPDPQS